MEDYYFNKKKTVCELISTLLTFFYLFLQKYFLKLHFTQKESQNKCINKYC